MTTYSHKPVQHKISNNSNGKCGEITFCLQVNKRVYALNCLYCSQICLQWDMFINHMEKVHDAELNLDSSLEPDDEMPALKVDYDTENFVEETDTDTEQNRSKSTTTELSTEPQHLDDPLKEDNSIKASPVRVKLEAYELSANQMVALAVGVFNQTQMDSNSQNDDQLLPNDNPSVSSVCAVQMNENHNDTDKSYLKEKDSSIHIDIEELLYGFNGKQVKAYYETNNCLNNSNRRILCDLIIDKIFEQGFIGAKDMPKICGQIVEIFPKEDKLQYYSPRKFNNQKRPCGFLFHRYYNRLRRIKEKKNHKRKHKGDA